MWKFSALNRGKLWLRITIKELNNIYCILTSNGETIQNALPIHCELKNVTVLSFSKKILLKCLQRD